MPEMHDDKSQHCIPFILRRLALHRQRSPQESPPPFLIGLNGVQGIGKTTLVSILAKTLRSAPYLLSTVVLSIDDFYLPHHLQLALASAHPNNPLVQHRGQPSTHDIPLAIQTLASIRDGRPTKIPQYDKSRFNGQGDRIESEMWDTVNTKDEDKVKVIILEGWCIGFSALGRVEVKSRWEQAGEEKQQDKYGGRLGYSGLENLQFVDQALERYSVLTDQFHALVYIDAEETRFVYEWRLEQEAMLRSTTGNGMTDEQVLRFVDGYYSSYELYSDGLRAGVFLGGEGGGKAQLTMTVGKDRRVKDVKVVDSDKKIH